MPEFNDEYIKTIKSENITGRLNALRPLQDEYRTKGDDTTVQLIQREIDAWERVLTQRGEK